eukprot:366259-Chlamydomonas_euryale.AAC.20
MNVHLSAICGRQSLQSCLVSALPTLPVRVIAAKVQMHFWAAVHMLRAGPPLALLRPNRSARAAGPCHTCCMCTAGCCMCTVQPIRSAPATGPCHAELLMQPVTAPFKLVRSCSHGCSPGCSKPSHAQSQAPAGFRNLKMNCTSCLGSCLVLHDDALRPGSCLVLQERLQLLHLRCAAAEEGALLVYLFELRGSVAEATKQMDIQRHARSGTEARKWEREHGNEKRESGSESWSAEARTGTRKWELERGSESGSAEVIT